MKKLAHILLSICFILVSTTNSFSQPVNVNGFVYDQNQQAIGYAYVIFMQPTDSSYVDGCLTDTTGYFSQSISKGSYILHIKRIGYTDLFKNITLLADSSIGQLSLKENSVGVKEVAVVATRPIVHRKVDRLVFDAENTISSHGANALELLKEVPGLRADNNGISIIGKGSIKVYINNRETKMTEEALLNLLRSYQADEISKVEVITTPPARYDAEGNTGIVNIILKSKPKDYWGGTLSGSEYQSNYDNLNFSHSELSGNFNYSKNKVSVFLNANGSDGKSGYIERYRIYYPDETWSASSPNSLKKKPVNLRAGIDYQLNSKYSIGIHGNYNKLNQTDLENDSTSVIAIENSTDNYFLVGQVKEAITNNRSGINFHIDHRLDTLGKKALFDTDYLYYNESKSQHHSTIGYDTDFNSIDEEQSEYDEDQTHQVKALSSTLDFILPFRSFSSTAGLKFSHTENNYDKFHYNDNDLDDQSNYFQYNENIIAAYADYSKDISSKISLKAGLRLEKTLTKGEEKDEDQKTKDNYLKLFPTIYLSYKTSEKSLFNFSFSNRIGRPSYNMVNPFKFYTNNYTYVQGKADLKPYYTYNSELSYTLNNNFNLSALYSYSKDVFGQVTALDSSTKLTAITWDNYITTKRLNLSNSYSFNKLNWLKIYLQQGLNYIKNTSDYASYPGVKGWNYFIQLQNNFYFNRSKTFTGTLSLYYSTTQYVASVTVKPCFKLDGGLRYSLFKDKLTASLNATNLFNIFVIKGTTISNDMDMKINNRYDFNTIRLSLSYKFGAKISPKSRDYSNPDIKRRL